MRRVWFGATLRGDNELILIGEGSNIQDGCVLHTDMGAPLTVGRELHHRSSGDPAWLHDRRQFAHRHGRLRPQSCAGSDATASSAPHALIPEGKVIPDNSLVMGAPGKVVREVTPEMAEQLTRSAQNYVPQLAALCRRNARPME